MNEVNIKEYGASPENADNSSAIEKTVNNLKKRGGVVIVPHGVYSTSTFHLASNTVLRLEKGAVIRAIPDASLYEANGYKDSFVWL